MILILLLFFLDGGDDDDDVVVIVHCCCCCCCRFNRLIFYLKCVTFVSHAYMVECKSDISLIFLQRNYA